MTLEEVLNILHPQDRDQLRVVFSQLINKEIENGQITLRAYNEAEKQYRHYESRMRLSSEHMGKLLIIGTQLDITEKLEMVKENTGTDSQTRTCHAGEQYRSLGFRCTYL